MRHWVLAAYDIGNEKRWRKIHTLMHDYGQPVQYSVFVCQLTPTDEVKLLARAREIIHPEEDQLILVRLQPIGRSLNNRIRSVGRPLTSLDIKKLQF
ncbi:MAG: CRISPR-associated endonuclease Cas2 [Sulfobacillus thermosulfidooxidans]|uniref:CRISPR-associated endoribonuclease Cas2 n=1 Tax=Sulfobacillus thermotolerans TaxID=338644 RepID=A0ABN5H3J8_9FIRM|nr:CRISPR-associated endonuclease Cas2 [Sulfobacillus thermotolerans]PSR30610.1 MAG: CRISPR-associated endonuclease Cas2 [Sulfobacillus thermosulfidooxidans]